jgi:DMSO reductase family type II enzyme chaperone
MEMTLEGVAKRTSSNDKPLTTSKDAAVARSFTYQFLARAYQRPDPDNWAWLNDANTHARLWRAVQSFNCGANHPLRKSAEEFALYLGAEEYESFYRGYFANFARGGCPLTESGFLPSHATSRNSALAGFYRQHGLVPTARLGEHIDHICFELEFMAAMAAKEACVIDRDDEQARHWSEAQTRFVREHLSSWIPLFTRRLASVSTQQAFIALAMFTKTFLEHECERMEIRAQKPAARLLEVAGSV